MIRRPISRPTLSLRNLVAGAAALTMATLTLDGMVVLPSHADARYATLAPTHTIVEVIGPTRLGRATPIDNRTIGSAPRAPGVVAAPERMLDRVAARSGRGGDGAASGSLN